MAERTGKKNRRIREAKPAHSRASDATAATGIAGKREELRARSGLLWDAQPRPSRGPKPALGRENVVQAAISVAD